MIPSNTSSMPEVAGNAAILINPYEPDEITEAMMRITSDQQLKERLIRDGYVQAAKFSWKSMAQNVLKIYLEMGGNKLV